MTEKQHSLIGTTILDLLSKHFEKELDTSKSLWIDREYNMMPFYSWIRNRIVTSVLPFHISCIGLNPFADDREVADFILYLESLEPKDLVMFLITKLK